jgi:hypothetical protein
MKWLTVEHLLLLFLYGDEETTPRRVGNSVTIATMWSSSRPQLLNEKSIETSTEPSTVSHQSNTQTEKLHDNSHRLHEFGPNLSLTYTHVPSKA